MSVVTLRGLTLLGLTLLGVPAACADDEVAAVSGGIQEHWGDGKAELNGYQLTQPRYGEERAGSSVLVFVTEEFTRDQRVKSDGGHRDEFPVMKLNMVRDFNTGIYDYNTLTSVFVPLDESLPRGMATKVSFSMQEWCGHVYDQLVIEKGRYRRLSHSYFDGEGDRDRVVPIPEGAVFADAVPVLIRGLAGEWLTPGETREVAWHPPLMDQRMAHVVATWQSASVMRSASTQPREVPAGTFEVQTWTVNVGALTTSYEVEVAAPHRLIYWERSDGESGALTGTLRSSYWEKHANSDVSLRAELGLQTPGD